MGPPPFYDALVLLHSKKHPKIMQSEDGECEYQEFGVAGCVGVLDVAPGRVFAGGSWGVFGDEEVLEPFQVLTVDKESEESVEQQIMLQLESGIQGGGQQPRSTLTSLCPVELHLFRIEE